MVGELTKNREGKVTQNLSAYQPSEAVKNLTIRVRDDYQQGLDILTRPWEELNNRSVIDDLNRGQRMFNAFVDTGAADPNEDWKWRGTRSMARNKGIAMHANLTANYLLPVFQAQNDKDEVDRDFSEVMRDIIEWMASPTNSNYQPAFLQIVFSTLQSPITYLGAEFYEIYQTIKEKQADGKYTTKEILDEVLSGFKAPIFSATQILVTNAYERNLQKQRVLIKREWKDKAELEAKYGTHPNWGFVQTGIKSIYNDEDGLFYDIKDDENPNLVAEETWLNRREDSEICFLNGIYMGQEDVNANPIRHRDNNNAPKYNLVPFGYMRIGDHFLFYKSMMNALGWDNALYDAMSEVVMNKAILEVEMPVAISGSDKIDSEVIFPSSVVTFEDKDTKVTPLMPSSNMAAGFNALRETEKSITEGSVNETISGQLPDASQKAFNVAQAQANAKKLIGAVGKSLAESVVQYGDLMKDIALNHYTVPQIDQLVGDQMKLRYRQFFLEKKGMGKGSKKRIKFDESLIGQEMTKEEKDLAELAMLEESGKDKTTVIRINPELFARYKYLTRCDAEEMFAKNAEYWQPVMSNLYGLLRADPLVKSEELLERLLYSYFQSEGSEMIKEAPPEPLQPASAEGVDPLGEMVKAKQNAQIATGVVS